MTSRNDEPVIDPHHSPDEQRALFFTTANTTYRLGIKGPASGKGENHV